MTGRESTGPFASRSTVIGKMVQTYSAAIIGRLRFAGQRAAQQGETNVTSTAGTLRVEAAVRRNPYRYMLTDTELTDLLTDLGRRRAASVLRNHAAPEGEAPRGPYPRPRHGLRRPGPDGRAGRRPRRRGARRPHQSGTTRAASCLKAAAKAAAHRRLGGQQRRLGAHRPAPARHRRLPLRPLGRGPRPDRRRQLPVPPTRTCTRRPGWPPSSSRNSAPATAPTSGAGARPTGFPRRRRPAGVRRDGVLVPGAGGVRPPSRRPGAVPA